MADKKDIIVDANFVEVDWHNIMRAEKEREDTLTGLNSVMEELNLGKLDPTKFRTATSMSIVNKIVAKIPKFTGEGDFTWEHLLLHLRVAAQSAVYSDDEMKLILFQALGGDAFNYMSANIELMHGTFSSILEQLAKVYAKRPQQNVNDLVAIMQGPNEAVHSYAARLISTSGLLRPKEPSLIKIKIVNGKREPIKNDDYERDKAKYDGKQEQLEVFLISHFLTGLRQDVKSAMKPEQYDTFNGARQAAIDAEYAAGLLHKVNAVNAASVDAATAHSDVNAVKFKYQNKQARGKNPALDKLEGNERKKFKCYRCQQYGYHTAKNCTVDLSTVPRSPSPGRSSGHKGRGNESNRPRSTSRERRYRAYYEGYNRARQGYNAPGGYATPRDQGYPSQGQSYSQGYTQGYSPRRNSPGRPRTPERYGYNSGYRRSYSPGRGYSQGYGYSYGSSNRRYSPGRNVYAIDSENVLE